MRAFSMVFKGLIRSSLVVLAAMATAGSALACSCGSDLPGGVPQMSFNAASIIFRGRMHGTEYVPPTYCDKHLTGYDDCRPHLVGVLSVEYVLKGSSAALIRVSSPGSRSSSRDGESCSRTRQSCL